MICTKKFLNFFLHRKEKVRLLFHEASPIFFVFAYFWQKIAGCGEKLLAGFPKSKILHESRYEIMLIDFSLRQKTFLHAKRSFWFVMAIEKKRCKNSVGFLQNCNQFPILSKGQDDSLSRTVAFQARKLSPGAPGKMTSHKLKLLSERLKMLLSTREHHNSVERSYTTFRSRLRIPTQGWLWTSKSQWYGMCEPFWFLKGHILQARRSVLGELLAKD